MSAAERKEETFTAPGATHTKLTDDRALSLRPQRPLPLCSFLPTSLSVMRCPFLFILSCVLGSCVTSFHLLLSYVTWLCVSRVWVSMPECARCHGCVSPVE